MFGRKKKASPADEADAGTTERETAAADGSTAEDTDGTGGADSAAQGPRDVADAGELGERIDLGALQVAPVPGMELRLELDKQQQVTGAVVAIGDSIVQLQAFAAPRSAGIWGEIRDEIEQMITGRGGTVDVGQGSFGAELRTRLPQSGAQGRTVFAPAVFAGVDGPRWLLRMVYSGPAAVDPEQRERLDEAVRGIVVVRGDEPRAPREMLPLSMPSQPETAEPADEVEEEGQEQSKGGDLRPFERGPEITEVR
ncbi:DUF3710 domain-containing protein [Janibacter alkaliphilus]